MGFIIVLIFSTISIAGVAAYFSIYGLAAIFSGIFWPVVLMGSALELGKLVAASYVYRFRNSISFIMKTYLISAILVLMLITSAGIFGFLSMGYQQDTLPLKQQEQQISLLETERSELELFKKERLTRRRQIDADIAALPNNFITGRERLMKSYGPELEQLRDDIELYTRRIGEKTTKISDLKQKKLVSEVHTGPIIFIAKAMSSETDDATKWMIILIMFAFDPLAVALTLAINHAILQRKKKMGGHMEHSLEVLEHILSDEDEKIVLTQTKKPVAPKPVAEKSPTGKKVEVKAHVTPVSALDSRINELQQAITMLRYPDITKEQLIQRHVLEHELEEKRLQKKEVSKTQNS